MCAFMPKYHCLDFWLECTPGSLFLSLFLVERGAAISVASTAVPALSSKAIIEGGQNLLRQLVVLKTVTGRQDGALVRQAAMRLELGEIALKRNIK